MKAKDIEVLKSKYFSITRSDCHSYFDNMKKYWHETLFQNQIKYGLLSQILEIPRNIGISDHLFQNLFIFTK